MGNGYSVLGSFGATGVAHKGSSCLEMRFNNNKKANISEAISRLYSFCLAVLSHKLTILTDAAMAVLGQLLAHTLNLS